MNLFGGLAWSWCTQVFLSDFKVEIVFREVDLGTTEIMWVEGEIVWVGVLNWLQRNRVIETVVLSHVFCTCNESLFYIFILGLVS